MNHYNTKIKYVGLGIAGVGALILLISLLCSNSVMIYFGIRALSFLKGLSIALLGVGGLLAVAFFLADFIRNSAQQKAIKEEQAQEQVRQDELKVLNKHGRSNPVAIRAEFQKNARIWYKDLQGSSIQDEFDDLFNGIDKQFDLMDKDQAKLKRLLDTNGADALRDTENILDKVEQLLCKRVMSFINLMNVYNASSKEDCNSLYKAGKDCCKNNEALLSSSKDFMLAIAKYLNSQDECNDLDELSLYKQALLQEIDVSEN